MKLGLALLTVSILVSAVFASKPSTQLLHLEPTEEASGPWHVTTLPAGGKSMDLSQAVLWNSKTGETWIWTGAGRMEWTPMAHAAHQ